MSVQGWEPELAWALELEWESVSALELARSDLRLRELYLPDTVRVPE